MAEAGERREEKLKVFLSYARDDLEFADQLVAALDAFGFEPLIDRHGISAGEDWKRRLGTLIVEADSVAFLLSPSALQSTGVRLGDPRRPTVVEAPAARRGQVAWRHGLSRHRLEELNYIFFYPEPKAPGFRLRPRACRPGQSPEHRNSQWGAPAHPPRPARRRVAGVEDPRAFRRRHHRCQGLARATAAESFPAPTKPDSDFIRASARTPRPHREKPNAVASTTWPRPGGAGAGTERARGGVAPAWGRRTLVGVVVAVVLFLAAGGFAVLAQLERREADTQTGIAHANDSRALAALSEVASGEHRYAEAVKLALASWPRRSGEDRPELRAAITALGRAVPLQRETIPALRHEQAVLGAAFSRDESRILTWSEDGTARLWDAATGKEVVAALRHDANSTVRVPLQPRREPDPHLVRGWHRAPVGCRHRQGGRGRAAARCKQDRAGRRLQPRREPDPHLAPPMAPRACGMPPPARRSWPRCGTSKALLACWCCLQPRREPDPHLVRRWHRAPVGCRHRQGGRGRAAARAKRFWRAGRRLQPRREPDPHLVLRWHRAPVGCRHRQGGRGRAAARANAVLGAAFSAREPDPHLVL